MINTVITTSGPDANLVLLKASLGRGMGGFVTIKPQYVGAWNDDIQTLSTLTGVDAQKILDLNPWLKENSFVADNHGYSVISLASTNASSSGSSSGSINDLPSGYYATSSWVFPLGVGTWYCTTEYKDSHKAIDLTTGIPGRIAGSPIYASKAGTVVQNYTSDSWGNTTLIRHDETKDENGNCYYTRYAHMINQSTQAVGDKVSQGDKIGAVGNTGKSTGYHLHFQIYYTSATRTDYTNFNATADFSVNPNTISDFPGIPWKENNYSQVNFVKSPYITDDDMKKIIGAVSGDGSVSQSEFDETVNSIGDKICEATKVDKTSELGGIIHDYIKQQLDGIKEQGEEAIYQLINGGNFYYIFDNFCSNVVNNSIWYIENKVGEVLVSASDSFVSNTKTELKSWVYKSTNLDPDSDTAKDLGNYLDNYVDSIVKNGWSVVTTAISTGDVSTACQVFLENTKRESIDFLCNVTAHGAATAITAYIPEVINKEDTAQIVTDLSIGIINTTVQSVGGVLKGDISIAQAAKNILSQAVISVTTAVVNSYFAPYMTKIITDFLTKAIKKALSEAGIAIGASVGGILGAIIGGVVSYILSKLLGFLVNKLVGFFTQ